MVKASEVKGLRQATGAGMMDCKKALRENDGDFEKARDWLRTKGLSAAARKSNRVTSEGLVGILNTGKRAAIIEVNSETDFVAKNEQFQNLVKEIAAITLTDVNIEDLPTAANASGKTVSGMIKDAIATIGENISLRRAKRFTLSNGCISSYVHNVAATDMGKIGVLVAMESDSSNKEIESLGRQIAMHIAATKPLALTVEDLEPEIVAREKNIFREQSLASGKPENIIDKMIEGRMRKFYEEYVLLDQVFVVDGKTKIRDLLTKASYDCGNPVTIKDFIRFEVGEGVGVQQTDFASEVQALSK